MADPIDWHDADSARAEFAIVVNDTQLAAAREQCLRVKGLPLDLAHAPTVSFAQGVVYQALANKQATQAGAPADEFGSPSASVQLRPFDGKIMALLIVPAPVLDEDGTTVTADRGRVASMIG